MAGNIHVFDYLVASNKYSPPPVCVVYGDEPFLRRLAVERLRLAVLGADSDVPYATFDGGGVEWRDVADELSTASLFGGGGPRLAVIDSADDFVSKNRERLEDYVNRPKKTGVLLIDVGTWASNTRLYKAIDKVGLQIECRAPQRTVGRRKVLDESRTAEWLTSWAVERHDIVLKSTAARLLLELVGIEFGMLDQELAKLALFVGAGEQVTPELVRDVVGGWKTKTVWEAVEAACDGNAAEAIRQLDRLLQSGESPLALFGQIAWSLRRFAAATRIFERGEREGRRVSLPVALEQAGFRKWPKEAMQDAQRQLQQLGRERASCMYRWLLEADLALKGTHSTTHRARLVLEVLFVKMASELSPRKKSNR